YPKHREMAVDCP
nr:Chain B, Pals1 peptide [synthetic construct]